MSKHQNIENSNNRNISISNDKTLRQMTLRINEAAWRELQMLRIETGLPVNKLLIDAVNEYLGRNGTSPVA